MESTKKTRKLLAQKMRLLRFLREWSQEDLAAASGLHRTYISSVERGQCNISIDNIERLASAFSVPAYQLLFLCDGTACIGLQNPLFIGTQRKESL